MQPHLTTRPSHDWHHNHDHNEIKYMSSPVYGSEGCPDVSWLFLWFIASVGGVAVAGIAFQLWSTQHALELLSLPSYNIFGMIFLCCGLSTILSQVLVMYPPSCICSGISGAPYWLLLVSLITAGVAAAAEYYAFSVFTLIVFVSAVVYIATRWQRLVVGNALLSSLPDTLRASCIRQISFIVSIIQLIWFMSWSFGTIFLMSEDIAVAIPVMTTMLYWCCHVLSRYVQISASLATASWWTRMEVSTMKVTRRAALLSGALAMHSIVWLYHRLRRRHHSSDEILAIVALRSRSLDEAHTALARIVTERHTHALMAANTVPIIAFMARTLIGLSCGCCMLVWTIVETDPIGRWSHLTPWIATIIGYTISGTSTTVASGTVAATIIQWTQFPQDLVTARAPQLEAITVSIRAVLGPETPATTRRTPSIMDNESAEAVAAAAIGGGHVPYGISSAGASSSSSGRLQAIAISAMSEHPSVRAAALGLGIAQGQSRMYSLTPPTSPEASSRTLGLGINNTNNGGNISTTDNQGPLSLTSPSSPGQPRSGRRMEFTDLASPPLSASTSASSSAHSFNQHSSTSGSSGSDVGSGSTTPMSSSATPMGHQYHHLTLQSPSQQLHVHHYYPNPSPRSMPQNGSHTTRSPYSRGNNAHTPSPGGPLTARSPASASGSASASPSSVELLHMQGHHGHVGRSFSPMPADMESDAPQPNNGNNNGVATGSELHIIVTPVGGTRRATGNRLSAGKDGNALISPDPVSLRLSMVSPASDIDADAPISPEMLLGGAPATPPTAAPSPGHSPNPPPPNNGGVIITSTTAPSSSSPTSGSLSSSNSGGNSGSSTRRSIRGSGGSVRPSSRQLVSFRRDGIDNSPPPLTLPSPATPSGSGTGATAAATTGEDSSLGLLLPPNQTTSSLPPSPSSDTNNAFVPGPGSVSPSVTTSLLAPERHPFAPTSVSPPTPARTLSGTFIAPPELFTSTPSSSNSSVGSSSSSSSSATSSSTIQQVALRLNAWSSNGGNGSGSTANNNGNATGSQGAPMVGSGALHDLTSNSDEDDSDSDTEGGHGSLNTNGALSSRGEKPPAQRRRRPVRLSLARSQTLSSVNEITADDGSDGSGNVDWSRSQTLPSSMTTTTTTTPSSPATRDSVSPPPGNSNSPAGGSSSSSGGGERSGSRRHAHRTLTKRKSLVVSVPLARSSSPGGGTASPVFGRSASVSGVNMMAAMVAAAVADTSAGGAAAAAATPSLSLTSSTASLSSVTSTASFASSSSVASSSVLVSPSHNEMDITPVSSLPAQVLPAANVLTKRQSPVVMSRSLSASLPDRDRDIR